jgi:hypothetical protein
MRHMSSNRLFDAVLRTAATSAILAAVATFPAAPAQAGEVVTTNCLHGSGERHSVGYGNTYDEQSGSAYGNRFGTAYSFTRPDTFRARRGFGFRRGFAATSTNPHGGGAISGADAGSGTGYTGGSSQGYDVGSRNSYGDDSCVETRHELVNPYVILVPPPQTDRDVADVASRDRLWQARCRPVIRQDVQGVRRYQYAAPGCDYGKYE